MIADPFDRTALPATDATTAELIDAAVATLIRCRHGRPDDAGAAVSALVSLAAEAEARLDDAVADARQQGCTWDQIAERLASTVPTARRRYAAYTRWRNTD